MTQLSNTFYQVAPRHYRYLDEEDQVWVLKQEPTVVQSVHNVSAVKQDERGQYITFETEEYQGRWHVYKEHLDGSLTEEETSTKLMQLCTQMELETRREGK